MTRGRNTNVFCSCDKCKQADPRSDGLFITAWERDKHNLQTVQRGQAASTRGRKHVTAAPNLPSRHRVIHPVAKRPADEALMSGRDKHARPDKTEISLGKRKAPDVRASEREKRARVDERLLAGTSTQDFYEDAYIMDTSPDFDTSPLHSREVSPSFTPDIRVHRPSSVQDQSSYGGSFAPPQLPVSAHDCLGLYDDPADQHEAITVAANDAELGPDFDNGAEQPQGRSVSPAMNNAAPTAHPLTQDADLMPGTFTLPLSADRRSPHKVYEDSHNKWFVRIILVLTVFLHTTFQLPFRACAILLFALKTVLIGIDAINADDPMPITLGTTLRVLGLDDRFHVLIACEKCHMLYEPTSASTSKCVECNIRLFNKPSRTLVQHILRRDPPKPTPKLGVPFQPLSSLLKDMLARPGMEEEMNAWQSQSRADGDYNEIMDGSVWQDMKGPDKQPFFDPACQDELRIGVTLSLDWFGCARSPYAPSHSSGAFAFNVSNLRPCLRYRPKNLLHSMMTPGPHEPTAEQLQHYNMLIVNDLLFLYDHGLVVSTSLHPEGIRMRVALLAIVCDHPAMCKMARFADNRHNAAPCTKCNVTHKDLYNDDALTGDFRPRDGEEHKRRAHEWRNLETTAERDEYFKKHGVRWTEFARLPYFDPVRMTIIDPMHNLLLGLVKNQWYSQWIRGHSLRATTEGGTKRELAMVHEALESLEIPAWAGRLPLRVGEPAGGSLGADEYKTLITAPAVMILPLVWDEFRPQAADDHTRALKKWTAEMKKFNQDYKKFEQDLKSWEKLRDDNKSRAAAARVIAADNLPAPLMTAEEVAGPSDTTIDPAMAGEEPPPQAPEDNKPATSSKKNKAKKSLSPPKLSPPPKPPSQPAEPKPRIHPDETRLTLLLSTAIKLILSFSIDEASLQRAQSLLFEYLLLYKKIHGETAMKPNHHFSRHAIEQIRDYGPVPSFWCFLGERLNKILKGFHLNNWGGGQMEITMMRALSRDVHLDDIIADVAESSHAPSIAIAKRLLQNPSESRGTVEVLAQDPGHVDDALSVLPLQLGPATRPPELLSDRARAALYTYYNSPRKRVYWTVERSKPAAAPFFNNRTQFYNYVLMDGRRVTSVVDSRFQKADSAIVKVIWDGKTYAGEVVCIFQHSQKGIPEEGVIYAEMRWMIPQMVTPVPDDPWAPFPELEVQFWTLNQYADDKAADTPPCVVPFSAIRCPLARTTCRTMRPKLWITTTLARHASAMEW